MTDISNMDLNALSYWFPLLESAGLPVPKTIIVPMCADASLSASYLIGGDKIEDPHPELDIFFQKMKTAADQIGYPAFLRTDHTSGKHEFSQTCHVTSAETLNRNIFRLVEFSELCSVFGLPHNNWALRELLPVKTFGTCPNYSDMPVAREFRMFVNDGRVECYHPYWPLKALQDGGHSGDGYQDLCKPDNEEDLLDLARRAGRAVPGHWSIDILDTQRGLYIIDMAVACESYHWEGCDVALRAQEEMAAKLLDMGL